MHCNFEDLKIEENPDSPKTKTGRTHSKTDRPETMATPKREKQLRVTPGAPPRKASRKVVATETYTKRWHPRTRKWVLPRRFGARPTKLREVQEKLNKEVSALLKGRRTMSENTGLLRRTMSENTGLIRRRRPEAPPSSPVLRTQSEERELPLPECNRERAYLDNLPA